MNLSLLDDAKTDALEAVEAFNKLSLGLGERFENELFSPNLSQWSRRA